MSEVEREFCAGGCGNEGPFEYGSDTCFGCIQEEKSRQALIGAQRLVSEAAAKIGEAEDAIAAHAPDETVDMLGRIRHECGVAVGYLTPPGPHQAVVVDVLRSAGEEGLPMVALTTRTGLVLDVLTTVLGTLIEAGQVEEFTHDCFQGEPVTPTARYRLRR